MMSMQNLDAHKEQLSSVKYTRSQIGYVLSLSTKKNFRLLYELFRSRAPRAEIVRVPNFFYCVSMRKTFLWFLLVVAGFQCWSQNKKLDSLYQELKAHPQQDTLRAYLLVSICYYEYT